MNFVTPDFARGEQQGQMSSQDQPVTRLRRIRALLCLCWTHWEQEPIIATGKPGPPGLNTQRETLGELGATRLKSSQEPGSPWVSCLCFWLPSSCLLCRSPTGTRRQPAGTAAAPSVLQGDAVTLRVCERRKILICIPLHPSSPPPALR